MNRFTKGLLGLTLLFTPLLAAAQAVIGNGTVNIGVRADGAVNAQGVGVTYVPTGADGLIPGCPCEAWGIANATTSQSGYTGASVGTSGITNESFVSTANTATSVVNAFGTFRVTHSFAPSLASANLYNITVSVQNISGSTARLMYGRAVDWDVPPTEFNELVTLQRGNSPSLIYSSDNGFHNADPLSQDGGILFQNRSVVDNGPTDHGAHFRFDFGDLAAGATKTFTMTYGAAGSTAAARTALAAFGAESYSFGEPSSSSDGGPNTYILAFKGTGGSVLDPNRPVNEGEATCVSGGYTGTQLEWCKNICERGYTGATLDMWIRRWLGRWRTLPYCAANPPPPPPA